MKFEDLKLVQKWREYAGPKDERLEAESAKIYKIGFVLLSFGMLMIFFYQFIARQVAWVHSDASEMPHGFATPFEAAMYLWLVLVMLICAGLQTRKGYVDTNRFGQTEHLPVGYFLLLSGLSGAARSSGFASADRLPDVLQAAKMTSVRVFGTVDFRQSGRSTRTCPAPVDFAVS